MQHHDEYVEFVTPRLARLRTLAHQLTGDWHRADDLVQTTLTKILLHWKRVSAATDMDQCARASQTHHALAALRADLGVAMTIGSEI